MYSLQKLHRNERERAPAMSTYTPFRLALVHTLSFSAGSFFSSPIRSVLHKLKKWLEGMVLQKSRVERECSSMVEVWQGYETEGHGGDMKV